MKILIISNSYWNLFNFRKNLIDSILDKGDNVILVAQKDKYFEKFKNLKTKNYSAKVPSRKVAILKDLTYIIRLYKIISKEKPDILITFTIKPNIYVSLISSGSSVNPSKQINLNCSQIFKILSEITFSLI